MAASRKEVKRLSQQKAARKLLDVVSRNYAVLGAIPHDIGRAETFGPLLAFELDSLTLVQGPVARILDGGKMDEDVLTAGPLDETVTLGSVEPLHYASLFHGNSFVVETVTLVSEREPNPGTPLLG
jgi:hypothetical protein